jgi:hypothetical protein
MDNTQTFCASFDRHLHDRRHDRRHHHQTPQINLWAEAQRGPSTHRFICGTLLVFALFALSACQKTNDKNPALLGSWQGTEWLIFDKPSGMDAAQVSFEFKADGSYTAQFGDQNQSGTWRTEKDKLYTQETGKQEIMVKLLKADATGLDFEMNRGGQKETLKLVKKG